MTATEFSQGDVVSFFAIDSAPKITGTVWWSERHGELVVWSADWLAVIAGDEAHAMGAPYPYRLSQCMFVERIGRISAIPAV